MQLYNSIIYLWYLCLFIVNKISNVSSFLTEIEPIKFNYRINKNCIDKNSIEKENTDELPKSGIQLKLGFPVPNTKSRIKYENKRGTDSDVGYLFDYLDDVFKEEMVNTFIAIWDEATSIKEEDLKEIEIEDEYETSKIIKKFNLSQKENNSQNNDENRIISNAEIIEKFSKITGNKNFKINIYRKSLDMKRIKYLTDKWKYTLKKPMKIIVDSFDLDGDGRLNAREFILFTIIDNKYSDRSPDCKGCYQRIFESKIKPMFEFFDCSSSSYIETEDICSAIPYLNRKHPEQYDMFQCKLHNSPIHTNSCNSFVLKNNKYINGKLTLKEFYKGILLGFWDRHVKLDGIVKDDQKFSGKIRRWANDGRIDRACGPLDNRDSSDSAENYMNSFEALKDV